MILLVDSVFAFFWTVFIMWMSRVYSQPGNPAWFLIWCVGTVAFSFWMAFYLIPHYRENGED